LSDVFKLKKSPKILVSPLEWGIGHATRCVPVIRELIHQDAEVVIGSDGRSLAFLKLEFPHLEFITIPGYKFSYPTSGSMSLKMMLQASSIFRGIKNENQLLSSLIHKHRIDAVISDNRFGLSSEKIPSVFITHQFNIQVPWNLAFLKPLINKINRQYIAQFNECWIPDFIDEPNLSGVLSHFNYKSSNTYFIGPLSRFTGMNENASEVSTVGKINYDILAIISGPEPQRSIFEQKTLLQLKEKKLRALMVGGRPDTDEDPKEEGSITIYPHLGTEQLKNALLESRIVLSRPGYSTIMDLTAMGVKAVFIPTPGQTEQEYLADYCYKKNWFNHMDQKNFDVAKALNESGKFAGFKRVNDNVLLKSRISSLLRSL
jgi:uncharacterized protein (TIGR00661 family)